MSMTYASLPIDMNEFDRLLETFNAIGAHPEGGITRLAASDTDGQARDALARWLKEEGAEVRIDAIGNMYGIFRLAADRDRDVPLIMSGSHLDSQTNAGKLDGTYGVLAACIAARALVKARDEGMRFSSDFCVVNWTNEEGARFRPSVLGSTAFVDNSIIEDALNISDDNGIRLSDALERIGYRGTDQPPSLPATYIEIHIEQGSVLEESGHDIGIVVNNWGAAKYDLSFNGEQAHTGPCPMEKRRDALLAAAHTITGVRDLASAPATQGATLHTSVGRLNVFPNSSNVVPSRTDLSIELRSADITIVQTAADALDALVLRAAEAANVDVTIHQKSLRKPRKLPGGPAMIIEQAAHTVGASSLRMDTISGHDAISLLGHTDVGLLFVPSIGGVSHNPNEHTELADLQRGVHVLTETLKTLCTTAQQGETP